MLVQVDDAASLSSTSIIAMYTALGVLALPVMFAAEFGLVVRKIPLFFGFRFNPPPGVFVFDSSVVCHEIEAIMVGLNSPHIRSVNFYFEFIGTRGCEH